MKKTILFLERFTRYTALLTGLLVLITLSNCNTPMKNNNSSKEETTSKTSTPKLKLVYYFDALCGWCYGFSPVMAKVKETYGKQLDIEVVSGGLFLGNRAGDVNTVAPHIKAGAYKSVEARTGVTFGKPFLDDVFGAGAMILNSLPPTIAMTIIKEQYPEKQVEFAGILLKTAYYDGLDLTDIEVLSTAASKVGADQASFKLKMADDKYKNAATKEFQAFKNSPHSGMPALVAEKDGQAHPISYGYSNFEAVESKLKPFLLK